MPRPNVGRTIAGEASLARRVGYEREARGWTYDALARRMTDAGCPINASALHKIEKGDPPRRITVDEFAALSAVFDLPLHELLRAPEVVFSKELARLMNQLQNAAELTAKAETAYREALREYVRYLLDHPAVGTSDAFAVVDAIESLRQLDNDVDSQLADRLAHVARLAKDA